MFQKGVFLALVGVILGLPASASAQQNLQNSGGLQSSTSNTQNTRNLQTPTNPTQGSSSAILGSQPNKLSVVGDPSQQKPSVTVGQSTSKTSFAIQDETKTNIWVISLVPILFVLFFWFVYKFMSNPGKITKVNPEPEIKIEKVDPKLQSKVAKAKSIKTTNKSSSSKQKKKPAKKRTHR